MSCVLLSMEVSCLTCPPVCLSQSALTWISTVAQNKCSCSHTFQPLQSVRVRAGVAKKLIGWHRSNSRHDNAVLTNDNVSLFLEGSERPLQGDKRVPATKAQRHIVAKDLAGRHPHHQVSVRVQRNRDQKVRRQRKLAPPGSFQLHRAQVLWSRGRFEKPAD